MRTLRGLAPILSLLLLLSSTVGLVAHDHDTAIERDAVACAIDHDLEAGAGTSSVEVEIAAPGEHHAHDCVGCHFAGNRSQLTATKGAFADLSPDQGRLSKPSSSARASFAWTGRTLRGPPLA